MMMEALHSYKSFRFFRRIFRLILFKAISFFLFLKSLFANCLFTNQVVRESSSTHLAGQLAREFRVVCNLIYHR